MKALIVRKNISAPIEFFMRRLEEIKERLRVNIALIDQKLLNAKDCLRFLSFRFYLNICLWLRISRSRCSKM